MMTPYETALRLGFFSGVFALMAVWEVATPRRTLTTSKNQRWLTNIGMVVIDVLVVRLLFPVTAVGTAIIAVQNDWGFFNQLAWPPAIEALLAVVVLDFIIYLQHVLFHAIPALWRLHRVHHIDLDLDVSSGARFHPIEIVLSMGIKMAAVLLIGPSAAAVVIFEILLNATALFNHSNVRIPHGPDRMLRWIIVTPDMHVIHHSMIPTETNRNFGFNLPWWDRLLGTYLPSPQKGYQDMTIGLEAFRDPQKLTLWKILLLPFFSDTRDDIVTEDKAGM